MINRLYTDYRVSAVRRGTNPTSNLPPVVEGSCALLCSLPLLPHPFLSRFFRPGRLDPSSTDRTLYLSIYSARLP